MSIYLLHGAFDCMAYEIPDRALHDRIFLGKADLVRRVPVQHHDTDESASDDVESRHKSFGALAECAQSRSSQIRRTLNPARV